MKNVGRVDAGVRIVLGCVALFLAATFNRQPLPAIGLAIVALLLFSTGLSRACPLYSALGINTGAKLPPARGTWP